MKINISYHDDLHSNPDEVRQFLYNILGKQISVDVLPDSTKAHDLIYFALQQMVSHDITSTFFDSPESYSSKIVKIRADALKKLTEILDTVIIETEERIT